MYFYIHSDYKRYVLNFDKVCLFLTSLVTGNPRALKKILPPIEVEIVAWYYLGNYGKLELGQNED